MPQVSGADLEEEIARLRRELAEALERQAATDEVLRVISGSPGALEPVFQAMLAKATKLCESSYGAMWLREGDVFHNVAFHGALASQYVEIWRSAKVAELIALANRDYGADLVGSKTYHITPGTAALIVYSSM
jgi:hypothetical protein